MSLVKLSKPAQDFYAPRFEVEIQSKKLSANISKTIMNVSIDEKLDEGVSFSFTMKDQFDHGAQTFQWLDHELFREGNVVSIKIGYANQLSVMVIGEISGLESSFFSGDTTTLTVSGNDLSYDYLKRKSRERTFLDKSFSDIVKEIATEAKLNSSVDDTGKFQKLVRKDSDQSYFAFLQDLARRTDREFSVGGKTLYFVEPRDDEKEIVTLLLGKDIINFRPKINTAKLVTEVEVRGHNPQDPSRPFVGTAGTGSERAQEPGKKTGSQIANERHGTIRKVITNVVVNSPEEAKLVAKSVLNKANSTLIEGDGECIGIPEIRPGVNIRLEKMGVRFSGKYYVKSTTHSIDGSGYRTRFSVKRNAV